MNLSTLGVAPAAEGYDRFIVKYREGTEAAGNVHMAERAVSRLNALAAGGKPVQLGVLRKLAVGGHVVKADRKLDRVEAAALMRQIATDPDVEYVEVDQLMKPVLTPNDTYYSQYQWDFYEAAGGMNIDDAWNTTSGSGVVVAVIDTGITTHSDLGANILPGYDFISDTEVSNDGNGRDSNPADPGDWTSGQCGPASGSSWHGTHVAGTVAAVTNNSKGVAGTAFNAKVVPARV
ncbi:MAG TPA: S8 family serine peptidase, partial [Xanthomonadaceae bacterium]|nr:S8 family serine peptidase [Xanthomonadaceae bacterium]